MRVFPGSMFLFGLLVAGCAASPAEKSYTDPELGIVSTYQVDPETGKYNGAYTIRDSTGVLLERGTYAAGALDGIRELFYPDSTVKVRERYARGEMVGRYEYYHPNGRLELAGYYVDGAMYGQWRKYDADGHLVEEVLMANNEERGPFREYYPDGKLQAQGTYLNGPLEQGILYLYEPSGDLYKTMFCRDGRCHTRWEKQ
jgi:antitoxin component YwqK of YwqJK toxin-antitoxin module